MGAEGLVTWCVFDRPLDHPEGAIARKFVADKPTAVALTADSPDVLNRTFARLGWTFIARMSEDSPCVVGVWL